MSWQLDQSHSSVQFSARHMMIHTVRGQFENFTANINFDEEKPENTTVFVQIEAASLNTRFAQRDDHLRSADFLDATNYPTLTFQSKRVEVIDESTATLIGDLTIRNVTKEVGLNIEYGGQMASPWGRVSAGFSAHTTISRKDWNLNWNVALETGGVLVGDKVKIEIELELIKVEQAEAIAA